MNNDNKNINSPTGPFLILMLFWNKAKILCAVSCIYIVSYVVLSFAGGYKPMVSNVRGVQEINWVPNIFCTGNEVWNYSMITIYHPLWVADNRYFHNKYLQR